MSTITLGNSSGSGNGTTGHTGSQSPSVAPGAQHQIQQANTPSSTTSALQSTPSPASRPASPSSSTGISSPASSLIVPTPPTKLRTCWNRAQIIAAWVAIAFTIASFVRDYLDITKDSLPSPQETWALQNDFRLSCEYDRRAELRSDACDVALSKPASPPPGISKRAPHERRVPRRPELGIDDAIPLLMTALIAGTVMMSVAIHKAPSHSREEQPIARSGAPSSTPTKEQNAARTGPSDQLHKQCGGIKPLSRSELFVGYLAFLLQILLLTLIAYLVKHEPLLLGAYEAESGIHTALVICLILLSIYTVRKVSEFLVGMSLNSLPGPVATRRQMCM